MYLGYLIGKTKQVRLVRHKGGVEVQLTPAAEAGEPATRSC